MNITVYYDTGSEVEFNLSFRGEVLAKLGNDKDNNTVVSITGITDGFCQSLLDRVRKANVATNRQFVLFLETKVGPTAAGKRQLFTSCIMKIADALKTVSTELAGFDFKIVILSYRANHLIGSYLKRRFSNERLENLTWKHGSAEEVLRMMKPNMQKTATSVTPPHPSLVSPTINDYFNMSQSPNHPHVERAIVNVFHCNEGTQMYPQMAMGTSNPYSIVGMTAGEYLSTLQELGEHIFHIQSGFSSRDEFPDKPVTWCFVPGLIPSHTDIQTYIGLINLVCERARPGKILNLILPIPLHVVQSHYYSHMLRNIVPIHNVQLQLKQPLHSRYDVMRFREMMKTELPKPQLTHHVGAQSVDQQNTTPPSNLEMLHELTIVSRVQAGKFSVTAQHLEIAPILGWGDIVNTHRKDQPTLVSSRFVIGTSQSREVISTDVIVIPVDEGTFTEACSGLLISLNNATWVVTAVSNGETSQCCLIKLDNHIFESSPKFEMDAVNLVT